VLWSEDLRSLPYYAVFGEFGNFTQTFDSKDKDGTCFADENV
jgi:hypothetical protein